ncbi:MAG: hypothetical protein QRY71_04640 [Candidatus Rhabdochlamydia sp.]
MFLRSHLLSLLLFCLIGPLNSWAHVVQQDKSASMNPHEKNLCQADKPSFLPYSLEHYQLELFPQTNLSHFFRSRIQTTPQKDDSFSFSVEWLSKETLTPYSLRHTFLFILDPDSLSSHTYEPLKKALLKSLSLLESNDTFNIVIMGKVPLWLSEKPLSLGELNPQKMHHFLEKAYASSLYSERYTLPYLHHHLPPLEDTLVSALIISRGSFLRETLSHEASSWLQTLSKKGSISLVSMDKRCNINLLQRFSKSYQVELIDSNTLGAFSRKLQKRVKDLKSVIAHDIKAWVLSSDATVQPLDQGALKPFLSPNGLKFEGVSSHTEDFTLVIEGKNEHHTLFLQTTISPPSHP